MSTIQVSNLTFAYEGSYDNIFENVTFTMDSTWRLGFTGRNGRGKTTFLRLLTGELDCRGAINKSVECDYFPFPVTHNTPPRSDCSPQARMTLEVLQAQCPEAQEWQLMRELNLLEFNCEALYRPFDTLSGGERIKGLLAALFLRENRFLLIDEPTNHLDAHGRRVLGAYLRRKSGFILVSHDRALLDTCTDHTLSINKTNIEVIAGNFSSWWAQKQRQDAHELARDDILRKDIKRLTQSAGEKAGWAGNVEASKIGAHDKGYVGHKSAKMAARAKAIEQRRDREIDEKSKLLHNIEHAGKLYMHPLQFYMRNLVEFNRVTLAYGENVVCEDLSFTLRQGERLAVTGKNGSGKSSVLKAILREASITTSGAILLSGQLKISYVPQDTSGLCGDLSDYARDCGIDEALFKASLRKLDFSRTQFEKDMADFSSGQKKKVLLARSLCEEAHLFVWDEPLNFIDVFSRMQVEELLRAYQPTMLFVEHDAAFCAGVATGEVVL